jgi:putative addiction module CopG family antidote
MAIVLSPEVEQQIEEQVRTGRFPSADQFVRTCVQLYHDRQRAIDEWRERVRPLVEEGLRDLEEGRYTVYDDEGLKGLIEEIKAEGRRRLGLPADAP